MPTHAETRIVPYSADEMFGLIADIGSYPEFLPWCAAARIRGTRPLPDSDGDGEGGSEVIEADLVVSFKVYRERFGSRVTLRPEARRIDVEDLDGPFRYLKNHWNFLPRRVAAIETGGVELLVAKREEDPGRADCEMDETGDLGIVSWLGHAAKSDPAAL